MLALLRPLLGALSLLHPAFRYSALRFWQGGGTAPPLVGAFQKCG